MAEEASEAVKAVNKVFEPSERTAGFIWTWLMPELLRLVVDG